MTTLMSSNDGEGHVCKCDESCYDAKGDVCTCICGGMNHGKGFKQAVALTNLLAQRIVDDHDVGKIKQDVDVHVEHAVELQR